MRIKIAIITVAAFALGLVLHYGTRGAKAQPKWQPFTAWQHTEVTGGGKNWSPEQRIVAFNNAGDFVTQYVEPAKGLHYRKIRRSDGLVVDVYDDIKMTSSVQYPPKVRLTSGQLGADCLAGNETKVKTETLFGITTVVKRRFSGVVSWVAPELGCVELQHYVDWEESKNPGTNLSALKLDKIQMGEPDPSLLSIPTTGYTEVMPSVAMREHLRAAGAPESALTGPVGQSTADKIWAEHRPTSIH